MFKFPYLESLVERNEHCRVHFKNLRKVNSLLKCDLKRPNGGKSEEHGPKGNETSGIDEQKRSIHWKKLFAARFNDQALDLNQTWSSRDYTLLLQSYDSFVCWGKLQTKSELSQHFDDIKTHPVPETVGQRESRFCFLSSLKNKSFLKTIQNWNETGVCNLCRKWLGLIKKKLAKSLEETGFVNPTLLDKNSKALARRACGLCSKILSNRKGLERHMLIHTGEKPYPCDVCGKPFRRKDNCARHKKTAHLFKKPRKPRRRRDPNAISTFIQP